MIEIARRLGAHESAAGRAHRRRLPRRPAPLPRAEILMDVGAPLRGAHARRLAGRGGLSPDPRAGPRRRGHRAAGVPRARGDLHGLGRQPPPGGGAAGCRSRWKTTPRAKRELRGRLADLCETVIDDPKGAIDAWRARLDDDAGDTQALSALDRLYDKTGSWRELVDVLRARERAADDRATRGASCSFARRGPWPTSSPGCARGHPGGVPGGGRTISAATERRSARSATCSTEIVDRWQDLADTLEADLALADSAADKLRGPRPAGQGPASAPERHRGRHRGVPAGADDRAFSRRVPRRARGDARRRRSAARRRGDPPAALRGRRSERAPPPGARHRDRDGRLNDRQAGDRRASRPGGRGAAGRRVSSVRLRGARAPRGRGRARSPELDRAGRAARGRHGQVRRAGRALARATDG